MGATKKSGGGRGRISGQGVKVWRRNTIRNCSTYRYTDEPGVAQYVVGWDRGRGEGWYLRVGLSGRIHQEPGGQKADRVDRAGGAGLVAGK